MARDPSGKPVLVYDADCGPCTRFKEAVELLDVHGAVRFESIPSATAQGLLASVDPELRESTSHLVLPDGSVVSGHDYLPALIGLLPGGRAVEAALNAFTPARRMAYGVFDLLSRFRLVSGCSLNNSPLPASNL